MNHRQITLATDDILKIQILLNKLGKEKVVKKEEVEEAKQYCYNLLSIINSVKIHKRR